MLGLCADNYAYNRVLTLFNNQGEYVMKIKTTFLCIVILSLLSAVVFFASCDSEITDETETPNDTNDTTTDTGPSLDNAVFVDTADGSDTNEGSQAAPAASITKGIEIAAASGKIVVVAKGSYAEKLSVTVPIYGGYDASDWSRNISTNVTSITAEGREDVIPVTVPANAADVVIDGFSIMGGKSDYLGYVVQVDGEAVINKNMIKGGDDGSAVGIYIERGSDTIVTNNMIDAGSASNTIGIYAREDFLAINNIISGGSGSATLAIQINTSSTVESVCNKGTLINNIIDSGSGSGSAKTIEVYDSDLEAVNNILTNRSSAAESSIIVSNISEMPGKIKLVTNLFYASSSGTCWVQDAMSTNCNVNSITNVNSNCGNISSMECTVTTGNISGDPGLTSDYHISSGSICKDAGTDPSSYYSGSLADTDFEGDPRPSGSGWDIGVDEI